MSLVTDMGIPSNYDPERKVSNPRSYQNQSNNTTIPPPIGAPPVSQDVSYIRHNRCGQKSIVDTYLLALVFGLLGAHHFYLQRYSWGVIYFFTFGLLGCGYVIDLFRVPYLVRKFNREHRPNRDNNEQQMQKKKDLSDAYVAWFPFGLLGFHHYYLENYRLGVIFTLTLGGFGLGWLIDGCRMPYLVKEANKRRQQVPCVIQQKKNLCVCYIFALPPLGWLGLHHFYMDRPFYGYAYTLSLGQVGIGWLIDLFRMPILLRRCNEELELTRKRDVKTVDDCYVMWFPLGLLGFHHYYLGRIGWGLLYTFTFGILGIGWLTDFFRIPCLVKDANSYRDKMEEELVADMRQDFIESPSFHSLPCEQNSFSGYNNGGYGSISSDFSDSTNDVMRLPTNGVPFMPYNSPILSPPAYSRHDDNGRATKNPHKGHLTQNSPPPYTK